MKSFCYTVIDELGLHARPAGFLAKEAAKYKSSVYVSKNEKKADCSRLFNLMGLAIKQGESITFMIDGEDEEEACAALEAFCRNNF